MMEFFYKISLSEEVPTKMNIFGFIFEKKSNLVQKSQNRKFKLVLAEEGYSFFKTKLKCLGSNKNVNVVLFCVVVQSKLYLWH